MKVTIKGTKSELEFVKKYAGKFILEGRTMSDKTALKKIKVLRNASSKANDKSKITKEELKEMAFSGAMVSLSYIMFNAAESALKKLKKEEIK